MYLVVGSGPSGMACASALVKAGHAVTVVDAGFTLEPEREARRQRMAQQEPSQWTAEDVDASHIHLDATGTMACKLTYGSDYPYRPTCGAPMVQNVGAGATRSYAQGGFSNVWGAALMPFRQHDMIGWPISAAQLAEAHKEVLNIVPFAAAHDELEDFFPLYAEPSSAHAPGRQVRNLLKNLCSRREQLATQGVYFGASRVAADYEGKRTGVACNQCGQCMHGCPRDLIYSSSQTLHDLQKTGKLTYISDFTVQRIVEDGENVNVYGVDERKSQRHITAQRVFLAAGVLNSSEILLRSFDQYDRTVEISDAQYYIFPILQFHATPHVEAERQNVLAQAYLEIMDQEVSPYTAQIQVYGYNDIIRDILRHKLGPLYPFFPRNMVLGRFLLAQGYLHSEHSGKIDLTLKKAPQGDYVTHIGRTRPETMVHINKVLKKLGSVASDMRAWPLKPLLQVQEPGRGYHVGGSFPMSAKPQSGQTDTLGRPTGWKRTHVVDSTVLPSIPATTITQTVMANAYRIAQESLSLNAVRA